MPCDEKAVNAASAEEGARAIKTRVSPPPEGSPGWALLGGLSAKRVWRRNCKRSSRLTPQRGLYWNAGPSARVKAVGPRDLPRPREVWRPRPPTGGRRSAPARPSSCGFLPKAPWAHGTQTPPGAAEASLPVPALAQRTRPAQRSPASRCQPSPNGHAPPEVSHVNPGTKPADPAGVSVLSGRGRPPAHSRPWEGCAPVLACWLVGLGPESNTQRES